jgi:hypothetical protein
LQPPRRASRVTTVASFRQAEGKLTLDTVRLRSLPMSKRPALAIAVATPARAAQPTRDGAVDALRARLAGKTAREHVVLDFLEDDLREVRAALAAVAAYVANVEAALSDGEPSQQRILGLALGGRPADRIEELSEAVASVRRRLAQVAVRM